MYMWYGHPLHKNRNPMMQWIHKSQGFHRWQNLRKSSNGTWDTAYTAEAAAEKMCPIFRWFTHIKHVYIEYVYTTYNRICIYVCMYINPIRFWAQIISNPHLGGWYPNLAGLSLSQFGYLKYPTKKTKISLLIHWFWWEVGSLSTATCRATLKVMSCP